MKAIKETQNRKLMKSNSRPAESVIDVVHQLRGRVRFRVSGLRGYPALCCHLEKELILLQGIRRASASAATGNLLVHYEDPAASRATGPLLRLTLWGAVGGYLALTLFRGFGGFVDALALGASALLSRAMAKGTR